MLHILDLPFQNVLLGRPSACHRACMQIRSDILPCLILVQTVCKGYQQAIEFTTSGARIKRIYFASLLFVVNKRYVRKKNIFLLFVGLICFFTSQSKIFSYIGTGLPGLNQYLARINESCSRTQHCDASEAQTHGPLVSSRALKD